ncbi:MAG: 50S ribosomal protein L25 [Thermodesulfobacteriota bacterium]
MKTLPLQTAERTATGNGPSRALRRSGSVPAVLYGPGRSSVKLSVVRKELEDLLKKAGAEKVMLDLSIGEGGETRKAIIKEIARHPVSRVPLHVDFYEIAADRKSVFMVPVAVRGKAIGVEMGGMISLIRRELAVRCLPKDVPVAIEVNVTDLNLGDALHVRNLTLPEGVEVPSSSLNYTVVTVVGQGEKAAPVAAEGEAGEGEEEEEKK